MDVWHGHILAGHPELRDLLDVVTMAIREPEVILESIPREVCVYYRLTGRSVLRRNDLFIAVVVARGDKDKKGVVKTAYLVKGIKKGWKLVWLKRV